MDQVSLGAVGNLDVDFNPLKMVYIVSYYSQSLILPCSWNSNVTNVEMKLEMRNENEEWKLVSNNRVERWTSRDNFNGLQLRFSKSEVGGYELYRCSARHSKDSDFESKDDSIDYGLAFVIAVERKYKYKE